MHFSDFQVSRADTERYDVSKLLRNKFTFKNAIESFDGQEHYNNLINRSRAAGSCTVQLEI